MQSRTKKLIPSEGTNGSEDRLSEMPDHLIVHILSFMPTLHAVKTMLLRRFGNLWTLVPTLTFDLEEYDQVIWPEEEDETIHEVFSSFARFIRKVLMLHKRHTIDSFHLSMKPFDVEFKDPKLIDDVQMWLRFAIDRQVKDLNLSFNGYDDLVLPHSIFMSQSLITLTLHGCMLEHQPNVHMGTLRELSLVNVKGSGQVFNQLILGCPSLRELNINISNLSHVLNITSPSVSKLCLEIYHPDLCITLSCPNMKNLDILVCGIIQSFMVDAIDVSSLQKMNVKGLPTGSLSLFKTFLRQFRNVEVVTWSCHALEWATVNQLDFHSTKLNKKACHSIVYQPRKLWLSCACLSCAVGAITGGTQHKSQCSTLKHYLGEEKSNFHELNGSV
ncbi:hypothetical protein RND81_01G170900 [Saponaria officinalis]|uniref:F-box/LRR-repeat protein 15/At3g58940/PEG3-like LRR domain-containing protein n=1 Tax=Saponaria officinalis TaxID=3572 RepID=A0AAW1N8B3_SAPOF